MKKFYLFLFIALAWTISASAQVPAFPGADGYGRYTTGGRGGEVYYVTSLEDTDTPGTLRYGVTHLSKVTILFKVSGTIQLNSSLNIRGSNITIAGQSAPGDGICLAGYPVSVSGSNVIVRYMRFRMGDWSLSTVPTLSEAASATMSSSTTAPSLGVPTSAPRSMPTTTSRCSGVSFPKVCV